MKAEQRDHPLGTAGASARRMAAEEARKRPLRARLSRVFAGVGFEGASWRKGAEGEEEVQRRLEGLPAERWIVMHDLPLGPKGRNLDHLVIGRGGVFSVNTKNLSGNVRVKKNDFRVNGRWHPHLKVARSEASQVRYRLSEAVGFSVKVFPLVVVIAPQLTIVAQPDDAAVVSASDIRSWLQSRPEELPADDCARIYRAARQRSIWTRAWNARLSGPVGGS